MQILSTERGIFIIEVANLVEKRYLYSIFERKNVRAKILNASAGSGKTYRLAYKYVADVIARPEAYRNILAVTFTNKATEEMKSRILGEIQHLAADEPSKLLAQLKTDTKLDERTVRERARRVRSLILHDYSRFTVLTIDTFFQRILRAFLRELNINLDYNVEIETETVLAKSADALVESTADDRDLARWLADYASDRIDEGVGWNIRDGILALGGEIFKEQNRERLNGMTPRERLREIVSQSRAHAAAAERSLRAKAREALALMAQAGVGHDDYFKHFTDFLDAFAAQGDIKPLTKTALDRIEGDAEWFAKGRRSAAAEALIPSLRPLLATLNASIDETVRTRNTASILQGRYRTFAVLGDLYRQVELLCSQENTMLLSETKHVLSRFIRDNEAPFIYEKAGTRFERFMIDEFQDTSQREWENFVPLLRNAMSQAEDTAVFLVGDVKQSIYRWRGGDWRILRERAREDLGRDQTEVENMECNYRSLPAIVDFNNRLIAAAVARDNAFLDDLLARSVATGDIAPTVAGELHSMLAEAYRGHGQRAMRSDGEGYAAVRLYDDEPPVAECIVELLDRGFHPCDIMILVRTGSEGARIAERLLDFRASGECPYTFNVMTHEALIVGHADVCRFVVAAMYLSQDENDRFHRAIYNQWFGNRRADTPLPQPEAEFLRAVRMLQPEEAFERMTIFYALTSCGAQTAYLQALHEQIIRFTSGRISDTALFLRYWEDEGREASLSIERSDNTIEISTIHKSKGLQRKAVVIPYCSWNMNPSTGRGGGTTVWTPAKGDDWADLGAFPVKYGSEAEKSLFAEGVLRERIYSHVDNMNLLYVALTRAEESLHVFIPRPRKGLPDEASDVGKLILWCTGCRDSEYGCAAPPAAAADKDSDAALNVILDSYPASQPDMALSLPSQRYFEDGVEVELSPRNRGILMHKAFEAAYTIDDVYRSIDFMCADGVVSPFEADRLRDNIGQALADPRVSEWFSPEWDEVRNECDIVTPRGIAVRRPDRVMTSGSRAVVVDYKFGHRVEEDHKRQIAEYMLLLRRMHYTDVRGYLWYVNAGEIVEIEKNS